VDQKEIGCRWEISILELGSCLNPLNINDEKEGKSINHRVSRESYYAFVFA
jgi:hypothetical protein